MATLKNKIESDFSKTISKQRIAKFMEIAKSNKLNLPEIAKVNPEIKSEYANFLNGDINSLYSIFTSEKYGCNQISEDLFWNNYFTSPFNGEYVGFPDAELC